MTNAWRALETLTAWSDGMRLRLDLSRRRFYCEFSFNNRDEFQLWQDYNRDSALVYAYSADFSGVVTVIVDIGFFMDQRFKYGMRKAPADCESSLQRNDASGDL